MAPLPLSHESHEDSGGSLCDRLRDEIGIVYAAPAMAALFRQVARIAPSEYPALITGESGTGKELVARALHHISPRGTRPFYAVNLASLSESVVESELFGHVKGAFTGATQDRDGYFVAASQSTLFLDEIAETSLTLQAKLLRAVQEREVTPVGSTKPVRTGARIVSATNRDLNREIREERFRNDLRFRLGVFLLHIPPLRDRPEDILLLFDHFLRGCAERIHRPVPVVSPEASGILSSYRWPGNVRELKHVTERLVVLTDPEVTIGAAEVREAIESGGGVVLDPSTVLQGNEAGGPKLADYVLCRHCVEVLKATRWNKTQAVKELGITTQTLRERLRKGFEKGWVTREEMEGRGGAPPGERRHPPVDDPDREVD